MDSLSYDRRWIGPVFFFKKEDNCMQLRAVRRWKKTTPVYQGTALPTLNRQLSACKTVVAANTGGTTKTKFNIWQREVAAIATTSFHFPTRNNNFVSCMWWQLIWIDNSVAKKTHKESCTKVFWLWYDLKILKNNFK